MCCDCLYHGFQRFQEGIQQNTLSIGAVKPWKGLKTQNLTIFITRPRMERDWSREPSMRHKRKSRVPKKVLKPQQKPAPEPSSHRPLLDPQISRRKRTRPSERSRAAPRIRRYRPGALALKEIRKYQKSTCLLIQKLPFARLVRDICLKYTRGVDFRWQGQALLALQEATEAFMVLLLQDSYYCTLHAKRITLHAQDMQLARRLRGLDDGLG
ncbi:histone H3-like centromeric protein A [Ambystoma mexicanum]|uniref:histone H3-like centromeric protein A n=1 Tax=Ambystoma mexicanum TaxID=8296 RepID=UPI0037E85258